MVNRASKNFLTEEKGKYFDPKLTEIVLNNLEEYATLIEELT